MAERMGPGNTPLEQALGLTLQRFIIDMIQGNMVVSDEQLNQQLSKKYKLDQLLKRIRDEKLQQLAKKSTLPYLVAYTLAKLYLLSDMLTKLPKDTVLYMKLNLPTSAVKVLVDYLADTMEEPADPEMIRVYSYLIDQLDVAEKMEVSTIPIEPMIGTLLLRILAS